MTDGNLRFSFLQGGGSRSLHHERKFFQFFLQLRDRAAPCLDASCRGAGLNIRDSIAAYRQESSQQFSRLKGVQTRLQQLLAECFQIVRRESLETVHRPLDANLCFREILLDDFLWTFSTRCNQNGKPVHNGISHCASCTFHRIRIQPKPSMTDRARQPIQILFEQFSGLLRTISHRYSLSLRAGIPATKRPRDKLSP
jgi:hypothetical protein